MHFFWERMPQLTQVWCQYEVSSKEEKEKKDGVCFIQHIYKMHDNTQEDTNGTINVCSACRYASMLSEDNVNL